MIFHWLSPQISHIFSLVLVHRSLTVLSMQIEHNISIIHPTDRKINGSCPVDYCHLCPINSFVLAPPSTRNTRQVLNHHPEQGGC